MERTSGRFRVIAGPATMASRVAGVVALLYEAGPVLNHRTHMERYA